MKINLTLFLSVLLMFSCVRKPSGVTLPSFYYPEDEIKTKMDGTDSLFVSALNLSEDMSTLSTKNDEIFVFIYDYSDTNKLKAPLVSEKVIFKKDFMQHSFSLPVNENLILFFIEEDSFRTTIQLEPVVRVYFKEIMKSNSYDEVRKYLGDDDLLGFKILDKNTSTFTISGMSSLDKYEYKFEIK